MSMTEAEKAEMKRLETLATLRWTQPVARDVPAPESGHTEGWDFKAEMKRLETRAALRWTQPVARDVPAPESGHTEGWDFNVHRAVVEKAWSEPIAHGSGDYPDRRGYRSASQGARSLFSTEAKAWAALRHELEQRAAESLREVDDTLFRLQP